MSQVPEKKVAVVTGAARGIGRCIALNLARQGIHILVSDVLEDEVMKTAEEIRRSGVQAMGMKVDVSRPDEVNAMIKSALEEMGGLAVLVNNAGVTRDNLSVRMKEEEWDLVQQINLKGTFLCAQAAAREMMRRRYGRIVNIASVAGIMGTAGQANYAASKAGVIAVTKTMARELGKRNITVNAIAPGYIETDMTMKKLPQKVREDYLSRIPLGRAGQPQDVANVVKFLVSPDADYITGTVINLSGGLVI